jgi:hypothetical protein
VEHSEKKNTGVKNEAKRKIRKRNKTKRKVPKQKNMESKRSEKKDSESKRSKKLMQNFCLNMRYGSVTKLVALHFALMQKN